MRLSQAQRSWRLRCLLAVAPGLAVVMAPAQEAPVEPAEAVEATGPDPVMLTEDESVDTDQLSEDVTRKREAVETLRGRGQPGAALAVALDLVAVIEEHHGDNSGELVEPLVEIADLQMELGESQAAEQTLIRLIDIIESTDSVFSINLVEPLSALASIRAKTDRRPEAITLLRRARHITHRRQGILNLDQIELLDQLADNYFNLGRITEGSRESRFAYRVNVNEYGENSAELVPANNALGAWYERIGEYAVARRYYKRSLELIEKDYGDNDLRMVDTLKRLANSYKNQGIYKSMGHDALLKAVNIQSNHPEADEVSRANSLTELADWQLATLRTRDAIETYKQVWSLLTDDGANPEKGNRFFREPKRLRYQPPIPTASRLISAPEVYVDVELVVTAEGSAREVRIVDATADWRTQGEVRSAMRSARFRPRFVDGEPVAKKISTRWTYRVPPHLRRKPAPDATTADGSAAKAGAAEPDSLEAEQN